MYLLCAVWDDWERHCSLPEVCCRFLRTVFYNVSFLWVSYYKFELKTSRFTSTNVSEASVYECYFKHSVTLDIQSADDSRATPVEKLSSLQNEVLHVQRITSSIL